MDEFFGELTGLLRKLAQDLLGGINLAEESAVDPGREAPFAAELHRQKQESKDESPCLRSVRALGMVHQLVEHNSEQCPKD